ncbi:MAG: hypothetical protein V2J02_12465 [Pseudomonadales bacterium]|nr:hypothetical protein [Pseudomonadales bacterium]
MERGAVDDVREAVRAAFSRAGGQWPGIRSVEQIVARLQAIPRVRRVVAEGPQSSVLIPLRMVRASVDAPVAMSTVLGTGPVADAIEAALQCHGIDLRSSRRLSDADSPFECSIREPGGAHRSLRLYPCSKARFAAGVSIEAAEIGHLVLNRVNKGLTDLATAVSTRGGEVSFRPHKVGRHDKVEDLLAVLPATTQLVLSTRDGVLQKVARALAVGPASRWKPAPETWVEDGGATLAEALLDRMRPGSLVLLHGHRDNGSVLFDGVAPPAHVAAPAWADGASRAARLQGALLGLRLVRVEGCASSAGGDQCLAALAASVQRAAFEGTKARPWGYGWRVQP